MQTVMKHEEILNIIDKYTHIRAKNKHNNKIN